MTDLKFKVKSAFDSLKSIAKNVIKNDPVFVSIEIKQKRLSICESCNSFNISIRQCRECGCFMDLKAGLKDMICHKDKWNE